MNETTDTYIGADGGYYVAGRLVAREIYERVIALQEEVERLRAEVAQLRAHESPLSEEKA